MTTTQYERISGAEINEAGQHNPQRAALMLLANASLAEAERKASGEQTHEPTLCDAGWTIALQTDKGFAGLWSCWLRNQFYVGYPKEIGHVPDDLIIETLQVERSRPVISVGATAVGDWNYAGEYKDADKPLVKNSVGQIVAYRNEGQRRWADFYGPQLEYGKGRVWVRHADFCTHSSTFEYINDSGGLSKVNHGHYSSMNIYTYQFSHFNEYAPEGPTTDPDAIQPYRDRFLDLLCKVARHLGNIEAVHINYSFVLVPEQLAPLGYQNIEWLKGQPGVRQGWGNEVVRGDKEGKHGHEVVILESGNSMVPWSTTRRLPADNTISAERLLSYLTF